MPDHDHLSTYLNDHLAGAAGGRDLARRALDNNRGTEFEPFLEQLAREIDEDRDSLLDIMRRLDVGESRVKQVAGWVGEKAARLKPNDALASYSPLSRVMELEMLSVAVAGKLCGWRTWERIAPAEPRVAQAEIQRLIERGEAQRAGIEEHRLRAVDIALVDGADSAPAPVAAAGTTT